MKRINKNKLLKILTTVALSFILIFTLSLFSVNQHSAYALNLPSSSLKQKLSFEKSFASKNLPSDIADRMQFKIENGNIIVCGYFPKNYTPEQQKEMFDKINKVLKKASLLYDSKFNTTNVRTFSYPFKWKKTYTIEGTKSTPVGRGGVGGMEYPGEILNYIDTTAVLYHYFIPVLPVPEWEKVEIRGFSSALYMTNEIPSDYTGLHLSSQIHVWGLSISYGYPPSGNINESKGVFNAEVHSPGTYVVKDWETTPIVRYGLMFLRFTEDQYVNFETVYGNKGFWYSLGKWF